MDWLEQARARGYFEIEYRVADFEENLHFAGLQKLPRFQALVDQIATGQTAESQPSKH